MVASMGFRERVERRGEVRPLQPDDGENEVLTAEWKKDGLPMKYAESWRSLDVDLLLVPNMKKRATAVSKQHRNNRVSLLVLK